MRHHIWTAEEREAVGRRNRTHGMSSHPLYRCWYAMIQRCENPRNAGFKYYGDRGITVCLEWHDPVVFVTWIEANLGPRPAGMSIDRIDNNSGYRPGNVRWATATEQRANSRPPSRSKPLGQYHLIFQTTAFSAWYRRELRASTRAQQP